MRRIACLVLVAACTDPRARPSPPVVDINVAASFELYTPGTVLGSIFAYDEDGLNFLEMSIRNSVGNFTGDSLIVLDGEASLTRPIVWQVPSGLLIGSEVTLAVRVTDFTGFATTDTLRMTVQDTLP
jgi:hypothetical protein